MLLNPAIQQRSQLLNSHFYSISKVTWASHIYSRALVPQTINKTLKKWPLISVPSRSPFHTICLDCTVDYGSPTEEMVQGVLVGPLLPSRSQFCRDCKCSLNCKSLLIPISRLRMLRSHLREFLAVLPQVIECQRKSQYMTPNTEYGTLNFVIFPTVLLFLPVERKVIKQ